MSRSNIGLIDSIRREIRILGTRPIYLVMFILLPLGCALFFMSLMSDGLPKKAPVAVVDYDHSELSRQMIRSLNATELLDVKYEVENYPTALNKVKEGDIFGFIVIPNNFQKDAIAGLQPTLEYYNNMTYFVPGTLAFKGFKTISVTTSGGVLRSKLSYIGLTDRDIASLMQPVVIGSHPIGNPWLNYSYYLTPSFTYATLSLLIMIMTVFTITVEIKHGTSIQWLEVAKGRMSVAIAGKMIPQTVLYFAVILCINALMFGYLHFPMNGSLWQLNLASLIFVLATQAFGVFIASLVPNLRLGMSVAGLLSVLTFSYAGFSFPTESMYGAIAIFSYIMPVRYLFLIYVNLALNGFDIYYVRYLYIIMLLFIPVGYSLIFRLKKACLNPVYVP